MSGQPITDNERQVRDWVRHRPSARHTSPPHLTATALAMLSDEQKQLLAIRDLADDLARLTRMAHIASRGNSFLRGVDAQAFALDARRKATTLSDLVRKLAAKHGVTW